MWNQIQIKKHLDRQFAADRGILMKDCNDPKLRMGKANAPPHLPPHALTIFSLFSCPLMLEGRIMTLIATSVPCHRPRYTWQYNSSRGGV